MPNGFTFRVHERPGSPFWWARVYLAGDGGRERRFSTGVRVGDGARERRSSQRAAEAEAERRARDLVARRAEASDVAAPTLVSACLEDVAERMLATKGAGGARKRWIDALAFSLDRYVTPILGAARDVRTIRRADMEAVKARLVERGLAAQTVNNALSAVRQVLTHAHEIDELLDTVPTVRNVPRDKAPSWRLLAPGEIAEWAQATIAQPLAAKPERGRRPQRTTEREAAEARHLVAFVANTGLRRSEALAVRFSWVDWRAQIVRVPPEAMKGGRAREPVACNDVALRVLRERWALHPTRRDPGDDRVFRDNRRMTREATAAAERTIGRARLHDLRHTLGSLHVAAGATLTEVRDTLGHATMDMVSHYQHAYLERRQATAARVQLAGGIPASDPGGASDPGSDPGCNGLRGGISRDPDRDNPPEAASASPATTRRKRS